MQGRQVVRRRWTAILFIPPRPPAAHRAASVNSIPDLPRKYMDTQKGQERWLPVADFEGLYEVSDHGRVRSLGRMVRRKAGTMLFKPGRVMSMHISRRYLGCVFITRDGKRKNVDIHRLVAAAFCAGWFEGAQVNHVDGCKANNHATNLEWITSEGNVIHAHLTGLALYRTEEQIRAICADRLRGMKLREIAVKHSVPMAQASRIATGKAFPWIDRPLSPKGDHPGRKQFRCLERTYEPDGTSVSYWKPIPRRTITQGATP